MTSHRQPSSEWCFKGPSSPPPNIFTFPQFWCNKATDGERWSTYCKYNQTLSPYASKPNQYRYPGFPKKLVQSCLQVDAIQVQIEHHRYSSNFTNAHHRVFVTTVSLPSLGYSQVTGDEICTTSYCFTTIMNITTYVSEVNPNSYHGVLRSLGSPEFLCQKYAKTH